MPVKKEFNKISYNQKRAQMAQLNGFHASVMFPGDGKYIGDWKNNKQDGFGGKYQKNGLIYDGQWRAGQRHGQGTLRKVIQDGTSLRIYIGEWEHDKKHGEGVKFYNNGIYFGYWKFDNRSGYGIMWYNNGSMYFGEWDRDAFNGAGVLFQANGNRYEGFFRDGKKHGEGLFYHINTGQLQKGIWENGICKTSILMDEFRNQAIMPTAYPLPKCELKNPDRLIYDTFRELLPDLSKDSGSFQRLSCIDLIKQVKKKFEDLRK